MRTTELKLGMTVLITSSDFAGLRGTIHGFDPHSRKSKVLIKLHGGDYCSVCDRDLLLLNDTLDTEEPVVPKKPNTYHDEHYQTDHQPIEVMQANMTGEELVGFLKGNIIKYACRCGRKDAALKEAQKIKRYAGWLVDFLEGKTIDPRK